MYDPTDFYDDTSNVGLDPLPDDDDDSAATVGPVDPRRRLRQQFSQGPAQQAYQKLLSQGPPAPPKPGLWQRLASAGIGAIAGVHDASGLRVGHVPVAPWAPQAQQISQNMLGYTDYNRQTQDYLRRVGLAQQGAEEEQRQNVEAERAYSDDLRDKEAQARIDLTKSQVEANKQAKADAQQARNAGEQARFEAKGGQIVPATQETEIPQAIGAIPPVAPPDSYVPFGPTPPGQLEPPPQVMGPGAPPADLPPIRERIPIPPPVGYNKVPSATYDEPNTQRLQPTPQTQHDLRMGLQPVPPDLKADFPNVDKLTDKDIQAARLAKAEDRRQKARLDDADKREGMRESARLAQMKALEEFRTTLQQNLLNAQDQRQVQRLTQQAIVKAQADFAATQRQILLKHGATLNKATGTFGFGAHQLDAKQQAEYDQELALAKATRDDQIKAAQELAGQTRAPGVNPNTPPRTPPPSVTGTQQRYSPEIEEFIKEQITKGAAPNRAAVLDALEAEGVIPKRSRVLQGR